MLNSLLAAAGDEDPVWLRTLATVLPFLGPIVVGLIAAPWLVQRVRGNGPPPSEDSPEKTTPTTTPVLPAPVAQEATQRAQADPLLRLLIEDLHNRLSDAHAEVAAANNARMADGVQIARLSSEVEDLAERYQQALASLAEKSEELRVTRGRLAEIRQELEQTRRRLQICMEGYNP